MKMTRQEVDEYADEMDLPLLCADGFDEAIIGVTDGFVQAVVYSIPKCVDILMQEGMTYSESVEHLYFNVLGAWVGDHTPIFVHTRFD